MPESLSELILVWGTPGDIDRESDGGGDYATTFKLTRRGIAKIMQSLGTPGQYRYADTCGCPCAREGDGVHVSGEPSDLICLGSPLLAGTKSSDPHPKENDRA